MANTNSPKRHARSNTGTVGDSMPSFAMPMTTNGDDGGLSIRTGDDYDVHKSLDNFWSFQLEKIEKMGATDFRDTKISQELPLARIKKIMKLDEDVKSQMISAEAPVLFAKACEMFIEEITLRAWIHTEDNKRKTLQKNDIAMAISKHDQFDFLIDIVPREEINKSSGANSSHSPEKGGTASPAPVHVETPMPMFLQVASPTSTGIVTQPTMQAIQLPNGQIVQAQTLGSHPLQLVQGANGELQLVSLGSTSQTQPTQVLHRTSVGQHHQVQLQEDSASGQSSSPPFAQAFQQIVAPDGSVHHLPIQLSPAQMNYLKQHINNAGSGQHQVQVVHESAGPHVSSPLASVRSQPQQHQQTAFFIPTSAPIGTQQSQVGVQLQMIATDHQDPDEQISSSS